MKLPSLSKWDVVRVEWTDPCALTEDWHKPSRKDMAVRHCLSIGFVYKVHEDRLTLTNSRDTVSGNVGGGVNIPLVNVVKVKVLERAK